MKSTETAPYKRLREKLKDVRERADLSQAELAKRLGHQQSFVSKCERGELRLDVMQFVEWCRALSLDPREVLDTMLRPKLNLRKR